MRSRSMVVTFGLLTGLFAAGYGVMFTVLDEFRDTYGISESALGVVVAMGFFSSFLAQVLIAPLADRGHARQLVYVGMLFNIAGLLGMAAGRTMVALLVARFVMGIGAGMAQPAIRRIVILAEPQSLGHNIGRLLAAEVAGFAAGPVVSALLVGTFGIPAPFLLIAVATVACLPIIARTKVDETIEAPQSRFAFGLLRERSLAGAVVLGSSVFLMIGTFDALWALVFDDLATSDWLANVGITVFAVPLVLFGPIGGRLAQRVGPFRLATVGLLAGAGFMFLYGLMPSGELMLCVAVFHSLSDGFTVSSTGVAVAVVAPAERQAGAQGLLGGAQTLTGGVTAVIAGAIYQHAGRTAAYTSCALAMIVTVAIGTALAGPAWRLRPESPAHRVTAG